MFFVPQNPLRYFLPFGDFSHFVRKMEEKKEIKKGGRPPKIIKRESKMGFNATKVERTVIQEKAKKTGLRVADYLRDLALKGKPRQMATAEELKLYRDIAGMANNLNQLTKEAHQQNLPALVPRVLKTLEEINKALKALDNKN